MPISNPEPGDLVRTVAELVTAVNGGSGGGAGATGPTGPTGPAGATGATGPGGGGGSLITDGAVCQLSNISVGSESSASGPINGASNSDDITIDGDTVNIVNDGIYTITMYINWVASSGETKTRNSGWQFDNTDLTSSLLSSYAFYCNWSQVTVTGADDYKAHISATGFIKAGSSFTFLFENLDPTHTTLIGTGYIIIARIA
jgi:hypothetical protein